MKFLYKSLFSIFIFSSIVTAGDAQTFIGALNLSDKDQSHVLIFKNQEKKKGRIEAIKNTAVDFLEENDSNIQVFQLFEIDTIISSEEGMGIDIFTEDDIAVFFESFVSRLPFFTFSKLF